MWLLRTTNIWLFACLSPINTRLARASYFVSRVSWRYDADEPRTNDADEPRTFDSYEPRTHAFHQSTRDLHEHVSVSMDGRRMKMFKGRSETTQNGTAHTFRHGLIHRHRHRHRHGIRLIQSLMNRDARNEYGVATVGRIWGGYG